MAAKQSAQQLTKALRAFSISDRAALLHRGFNTWEEMVAESHAEAERLRAATLKGRMKRGVRRLRQWQRKRRSAEQWHFAVAPSVQSGQAVG